VLISFTLLLICSNIPGHTQKRMKCRGDVVMVNEYDSKFLSNLEKIGDNLEVILSV
jgi:hypothetical protein